MLILKRLAVWSLEMLSEALLLSLVLIGLSGPSRFSFLSDLRLNFLGTAGVFMVGTGYLLTTAVLRAIWGTPRLWLYSAAAAGLFLTHLQVLLFAGWALPDGKAIQVAGACIVFACTFVGGWLLQKWVASRLPVASEQHRAGAKS